MPRFMNTYDVEEAVHTHASHPVLGPAVRTLENLVEWTNRNSDGWAYWHKPSNAAAKLVDLITGPEGTRPWDTERPDATPEALRKALVPIKAFRTRQHADFTIVETLPEPEPEPTFPALEVSPEVARLLENLATAIGDDLDLLRRGKGDPLAGLEDTAAQLANLAAGVHTGLSLS